MDDTACAVALVGKEGLEPSRLAAHDPKSCSSASSDTSPTDTCYTTDYTLFAPAVHTSARGFRLIDRHGRHAHIANPLPAILPIHIASPPHTHVIPAQTHVILTPTTPSTRATSVTPTPTTPSTHPPRHSRNPSRRPRTHHAIPATHHVIPAPITPFPQPITPFPQTRTSFPPIGT